MSHHDDLIARVRALKPAPTTPLPNNRPYVPRPATMSAPPSSNPPVSPEEFARAIALVSIAPVKPVVLGAYLGDIAKQERAPIRAYPTGYPDLDLYLQGGIKTRQLTTVMGPPGAGKTAWVVDLALRMARAGLSVLIASLELEADELEARFAGVILGVPWSDIVCGRVHRDQIRACLTDLQIRIISCEEMPRDGTAMAAIASTSRAMAEAHGAPPLLIIDYLQELARGTDATSLRAKIGDIATALRGMAQDLDCPLIAVSSIARTYYSAKRREEFRAAKDATVYLAAAKESGDVDFAAAVVLFLDVDQEIDDGQEYRLAQIAVAKARHGIPGKFAGARFHGATGRWQSDPGAVEALGDESRSTSRVDAQHAAHEAKVLATVERLRAKPRNLDTRKSGLMSKSDLQGSCGIKASAASAAIARLLLAERLDDTTETFEVIDGNLRSSRTRKVIDLPAAARTIPTE